MKTNKAKKLLCLAMGAMMVCGAAAGCGSRSSSSDVQFWVYGSMEEINMYRKLTDTFNSTYGAEHGITVNMSTKDSGMFSTISNMVNVESGPDVFIQIDNDWKQRFYGYHFTEIQEYVDQIDIDISDIRDVTLSRFRIDRATNSSDADDPLAALPLSSQPTAIYYNKTLFESAGIKVISVDEEDLDAWNAGEIADNTGKKKSDYGITIDVPAKGYYRSINPYYFDGVMTKTWKAPTSDEILIFNNRIAMNWDEIEDLAMLFSPTWNPQSTGSKVSKYGTDYGFFTEWWFNYGWSVGGDCLQDLTGNGNWNFSLLDPNPNYIVQSGTYTGAYTGTVYQVGETLDFKDKMDIAQGELVTADEEGDYYHSNGTKATIRSEVASAENLGELPSTLEAFTRYLKLGADTTSTAIGRADQEYTSAGINVSPNPNAFTGNVSCMTYFWSKRIPMAVNTSAYMSQVSKQSAANKANFEWDIAPLPIYKEYTSYEPDCDEVAVMGKKAGHSNTISMALKTKSPRKLEAVTFMVWAASAEGQKVCASLGFFPNQDYLMSEIKLQGTEAANLRVFTETIDSQRRGDWMYMPDHSWVEEWCTDLNADVRNGTKTYAAWYSPAIRRTNAALLEYSEWTVNN